MERVMHSDWATPIVPVPKKDGSGDYKVTVNLALEWTSIPLQYQLPKPEDIFATLSWRTAFSKIKLLSKINLSQAYQQLLLDNDSAISDSQHSSRLIQKSALHLELPWHLQHEYCVQTILTIVHLGSARA